MRKEIDSSQLSVFVFIAVMALKIFLAPGLLIKYSGRDGWISMLIFVIIELAILLMVLFIIKLNPDKSLYEVLKFGLGKIGAKIFLAVICVFFGVKLIIMLGELKLFFNTSILKSIDFVVCLIVLLFMLAVFASKGLRPVGRMAQIFFPFVIAALAILFLLTVGNLELKGLTPVIFDKDEILGTLTKFPIWFGDVAVLLVFTGKVKQKKRFILGSMVSALISSAAVMYFAIVLFATYGDYPVIIDYGHNISNMVVYSSGSYLFGRFDIPIFCVWMISIFIQIIINFYAISSFLCNVAGKGSDGLWGIVLAVILFVLCQFVFNTKSSLFELGTGFPRWLCLAVEVVLPVIMLIISLIERRKKKDSEDDISKESNTD